MTDQEIEDAILAHIGEENLKRYMVLISSATFSEVAAQLRAAIPLLMLRAQPMPAHEFLSAYADALEGRNEA